MIERSSLDKNVTPNQEPNTLEETMPEGNLSSLEQWEAVKSQQMSRRHLLTVVTVGGGVVAASALLAACGLGDSQTATYGSSSTTASQGTTQAPAATQAATQASKPMGAIVAHAGDVPVNSAKTFALTNQKNPGVLVHLSDQKFVAFDSTCTHEQCSVAYNANTKLLECPCHGAAFDPAKNAAVVQGPAQTPLTPINITVNSDGSITMS
ncbi:MAG TPA: Rieske (2Fe-2S) protein [Ktedonobacteraceae bacterium]|nr:Rieske (2Fe-2S) protein [Ktedonobacteraceae bacterium]